MYLHKRIFHISEPHRGGGGLLQTTTLSSGVGHHCNATGHSVSLDNTKVLTREPQWTKRKVKEAIYIKKSAPSMNRERDTSCPRSTSSSCFLSSSRERKHHVTKASRWEVEMSWSFKKNDPKWVKKSHFNNMNVISEVTLYCIPVYCVRHIELDNLSKLMLKKKVQNTQLSSFYLVWSSSVVPHMICYQMLQYYGAEEHCEAEWGLNSRQDMKNNGNRLII